MGHGREQGTYCKETGRGCNNIHPALCPHNYRNTWQQKLKTQGAWQADTHGPPRSASVAFAPWWQLRCLDTTHYCAAPKHLWDGLSLTCSTRAACIYVPTKNGVRLRCSSCRVAWRECAFLGATVDVYVHAALIIQQSSNTPKNPGHLKVL
jgi:hypothetical protein